MSYNIDTCKVKEIENLIVPIQSFFKCERKHWHPRKEIDGDNIKLIDFGEDIITGKIKDDKIIVESFSVSGEGSGTMMNYIIEPALRDSVGYLEVSFIWERGDSINKMIVKDGDIKWKDIEI